MYVIELEGHNDGYPYEEERWTDSVVARERLEALRLKNPKVRWRLIKIVKDYDDVDTFARQEMLFP